MAKTKISTLAKELNVALPTVFSYLSEKGITVEESPNTRVEDDVVELLVSKFKPDKDLKKKSDEFGAARRPVAPAPKPEPAPEIRVIADPVPKPRVVGRIDLDSKGNPLTKKTETAPEKPVAKTEEKSPEPPVAKVKNEPVVKETPKPDEKPAEKPVEKVAEKTEEKPVAQEKKGAEPIAPKSAPQAENRPKPEKKETPPQPAKETATPTPQEVSDKPAEPEIFAPSAPKSPVNLKIVG